VSPYQFQADRSDVLRQQLVQLPTSIRQPLIDNCVLPETPARRRRRTGLWLGSGALGGVLVLGALALALTPEDSSEDASRVIESLARPQQETDKLPARALSALGNVGVDPSQTRLLGHSATITYYGAPTAEKVSPGASSGKTICIIPVGANGESRSIGCTLLRSFESYGLKIETPDRTEAGWLVVPAGAETSLESVKNENGWTQQAPNFLVRNNN
jgi:hypothetical protein